MTEFYVTAALSLVAMGMVIGVVLIISIGIHLDERALRRRKVCATSYAAKGARRLLSGKRLPDTHPESRTASPQDVRV